MVGAHIWHALEGSLIGLKYSSGVHCKLADSVFWRPPRHSQQLKYFLLISSLHKTTLREPCPIPPSNHVLPQAMLIEPHPLLAREQSDAAIEDVISREINQSRTELIPWDEEEIDSPPNIISRKSTGTMPFAAVISFRSSKTGPQIAFLEEVRNDSPEHDSSKKLDGATMLCDNEINVATVLSSTTIGASYGELKARIDLADRLAHELIVLIHLLTRNTTLEVFEMLNTNPLVFGQSDLAKEVINIAVALLNPSISLYVSNTVNLEEPLKDLVVGVLFGVVQTTEAIGTDDLFDFVC